MSRGAVQSSVACAGDWLTFIPTTLGERFTVGEVFVIDSIPLAVCRWVRARRCRKVRGREYCSYCAAKREKFFGWRLHVLCRPDGIPVRVQLLPAGFHDLTPVHELAYGLPVGARLLGDKGDNSAPDEASIRDETGVRLVPIRRANMRPHAWFVDDIALHDYRHTIETVNSQLEQMGVERVICANKHGFRTEGACSTHRADLHQSGLVAHHRDFAGCRLPLAAPQSGDHPANLQYGNAGSACHPEPREGSRSRDASLRSA